MNVDFLWNGTEGKMCFLYFVLIWNKLYEILHTIPSVFLVAKISATKSPWGVANSSSATAVSVVTDRTAAAAGTILTSTPSYTSRVLGCLSHMTRVFVPVINTSISVCDTKYHFSSNTDGYAWTESGQHKVGTSPRWLTQTSYVQHSISDS